MQLLAIIHDEAGQPIRRAVIDQGALPITDLQAQHLAQGLEIVVLRGGQRIDLRRADVPAQRTRQIGARP